MCLSFTEKLPASYTSKTGKVPPVLALGVRGPKARSTLQSIVGPSDPRLASVMDCSSINAIYGRSPAEPLVYLPFLDSHVHEELCLWFGARATCAVLPSGVLGLASRCDRARWWPWMFLNCGCSHRQSVAWRPGRHAASVLCLYISVFC